MKSIAIFSLAFAGLAAAAVAFTVSGQENEEAPKRVVGPTTEITILAPPRAPGGVKSLLYARPFRLERGYENSWRKDGGTVSEGLLVVLEVDPALVEPKSEYEPILYAGDEPVERVNLGNTSGRVVGIVPGSASLALEATPIWFGEAGLPEQVTAASAAAARAQAEKAGVRPFPAASVASARTRGGEPALLADYGALRRLAAELILEWSPDERELAEGILAPPVR